MIFIHPDGTSMQHYAAARALYVGPDADLHWDRLPHMAVYRGHISDYLTATSNAGGTIHAYGVKAPAKSYGGDGTVLPEGRPRPVVAMPDGSPASIAHRALRAGIPVGVVNSGINTEPGTGCFLALVHDRSDHAEIALQLVESGAQVILGGGERYFLPAGVKGRHGGEGARVPGAAREPLNVVEFAQSKGYTVVYTREELLNLPAETKRVLGLFANEATFNDLSEEVLKEKGLPDFDPNAPTLAQMTAAALKVLSNNADRFLLLIEEEGTDNFGNRNNARGTLEALHRADDAIGVARAYVAEHPRTLLFTAADSGAGGLQMFGVPMSEAQKPLPALEDNGAPLDGRDGTGTLPFIAKPDRAGRAMPFAVSWGLRDDASDGVLVRGEGFMAAELIRGTMDNTRVPAVMHRVLFGKDWEVNSSQP